MCNILVYITHRLSQSRVSWMKVKELIPKKMQLHDILCTFAGKFYKLPYFFHWRDYAAILHWVWFKLRTPHSPSFTSYFIHVQGWRYIIMTNGSFRLLQSWDVGFAGGARWCDAAAAVTWILIQGERTWHFVGAATCELWRRFANEKALEPVHNTPPGGHDNSRCTLP